MNAIVVVANVGEMIVTEEAYCRPDTLKGTDGIFTFTSNTQETDLI
jgi:hypothetical protein